MPTQTPQGDSSLKKTFDKAVEGEKIITILKLKLINLGIARKKFTGSNNTPSKRVVNGKIHLINELLLEINKLK